MSVSALVPVPLPAPVLVVAASGLFLVFKFDLDEKEHDLRQFFLFALALAVTLSLVVLVLRSDCGAGEALTIGVCVGATMVGRVDRSTPSATASSILRVLLRRSDLKLALCLVLVGLVKRKSARQIYMARLGPDMPPVDPRTETDGGV